jgi:uncharacterized protein Usg
MSIANTTTPFEQMLQGFRLTTAQILYRFPDHPSLLQTYLWQDYDVTPDFPVLYKFLNFWERELDGKLHSVFVESCEIIKPSDFKPVSHEFYLN